MYADSALVLGFHRFGLRVDFFFVYFEGGEGEVDTLLLFCG